MEILMLMKWSHRGMHALTELLDLKRLCKGFEEAFSHSLLKSQYESSFKSTGGFERALRQSLFKSTYMKALSNQLKALERLCGKAF